MTSTTDSVLNQIAVENEIVPSSQGFTIETQINTDRNLIEEERVNRQEINLETNLPISEVEEEEGNKEEIDIKEANCLLKFSLIFLVIVLLFTSLTLILLQFGKNPTWWMVSLLGFEIFLSLILGKLLRKEKNYKLYMIEMISLMTSTVSINLI